MIQAVTSWNKVKKLKQILAEFRYKVPRKKNKHDQICHSPRNNKLVVLVPGTMYENLAEDLRCKLIQYIHYLSKDPDKLNSQFQYILVIDENTSIKDLEDVLIQALVYRFIVFLYEVTVLFVLLFCNLQIFAF